MSELIQKNDNRATIRWKLLTGVSALALTAYVSSTSIAKAEDPDRPTVWIELGGQMEQVQGLSSPFTAPFMSVTPAPAVYDGGSFVKLITPAPTIYQGDIFTGSQKPARFAFGEEGKISFQPEDSDWIFSAGVRYGRSNSERRHHRQTYGVPVTYTYHAFGYYTNISNVVTKNLAFNAFADTKTRSSERHTILDFTAGKDVGLGLFGHGGSSTINAGVRIASFRANSAAAISARPEVNGEITHYNFYLFSFLVGGHTHLQATFYQYKLSAHAERSFKGIGPTLSWNASAALAGNEQDGELAVDWGINAALLFGRQKAKTDHSTRAFHNFYATTYVPIYPPLIHAVGYAHHYDATSAPVNDHSTRSRSVSVPNIGGYAGLSVKYSNAKVSIGYRYDTFLKAMDTGIDSRKTSNLTFNGPFASISIGLGD